ncbi:hypothetical protein MFRU_028g00250 [Monilinia fructicola]|nr:hypothetical protein MFRU_028g00250 [Monilinia fructicola]
MNSFQDLVSMTLAFDDEATVNSPEQSGSLAQGAPEFKRFSELPAEVRSLVWRFTVPSSRLVEERFCREPLVSSPCPLNGIPSSSMPDSFLACFESKEEITKHYAQDTYGGDRGQARDDLPIHFSPSVPFNPDQDTLLFDSLFTTSTDEWRIYDFFQGGPMPVGLSDWRNDQFPFQQQWIIKPWTVKRVQITPRSLYIPMAVEQFNNRYEEDNFAEWDRVFVGFVFQDLDTFIVQDFDCKLTHKHFFYSLENQEDWKVRISLMFQVETTHHEYSDMRAGSTFAIPTIEIRPGAKIEKICEQCADLAKFHKISRKLKRRESQIVAMFK